MATTAMDVILGAIKQLGVYAPGETMSDGDSSDALDTLNDMLDSWSIENLAMFAQLTQSFPMVANQVQYTIGPTGANITGTRPLKINQAYMLDPQFNNYDIDVIEQYEFNKISNRQINGQIPNVLFYDPQVPNGIINIWPKPALTWTVYILSYLQFDAFPNLVTVVELPKGYVPALKFNLAIAIAPMFGKVPQPITIELASRYLGNVKRKNTVDIPATFDRELCGRGDYNIQTDGY